jgi:hypothetical protein
MDLRGSNHDLMTASQNTVSFLSSALDAQQSDKGIFERGEVWL